MKKIKIAKATDQQRLLLLMKELERESDRGCALAAASYLDDKLRQLLQARMVQHTAVDDLLENPDGLRTFSVRTNLAFALGIISREVFSDLNRIRDIRNSFGHILELRLFTHPTVVHVCNSLENVLEDLLLKRKLSAPRARFVKSVMAIETILSPVSRRVNGQGQIEKLSSRP